ncbi:Ribosome maturation factor RimP [Sphingomonas antarctica]|uniref:ribosome maturation protein RimP n=1 Tax=Sphingomonas antarctica TaxID=2040274 RepID=UPI0039E8FB44
MDDLAELTALIEPEARALGLNLVRVAMFGGEDGPVLQVMAERPDTRQLTLADCGSLSRRLSEVFDEVDPIEEAYRLEVSSPGIDRPLTRLGDYADWVGHRAKLKLIEALGNRKQVDGDLAGVEGDDVLIAVTDETLRVPFAQIAAGKLVLTDKLIAATAPLDAGDAEELEEEDDD